MDVQGASRPGSAGRENADGWGWVKSSAWVLDGASQPPGVNCCGFTEVDMVKKASQFLLEQADSFGANLRLLVAHLTEYLTAEHLQHHTGKPGPGPAATVALLHQTEEMLTWLVLGDAGIFVDGQFIIDQRLQTVAGSEREQRRKSHSSVSGAKKAWLGLYEAELKARNQVGGYWVLTCDGRDASGEALVGSTVSQDVLLCTDGFHGHWRNSTGLILPDPLTLVAQMGPLRALEWLSRMQAKAEFQGDDSTVVLLRPGE